MPTQMNTQYQNFIHPFPVRRRKLKLRYAFTPPLRDNIIFSASLNALLGHNKLHSMRTITMLGCCRNAGLEWQIIESQTRHEK
jgi:hypothetical protein